MWVVAVIQQGQHKKWGYPPRLGNLFLLLVVWWPSWWWRGAARKGRVMARKAKGKKLGQSLSSEWERWPPGRGQLGHWLQAWHRQQHERQHHQLDLHSITNIIKSTGLQLQLVPLGEMILIFQTKTCSQISRSRSQFSYCCIGWLLLSLLKLSPAGKLEQTAGPAGSGKLKIEQHFLFNNYSLFMYQLYQLLPRWINLVCSL